MTDEKLAEVQQRADDLNLSSLELSDLLDEIERLRMGLRIVDQVVSDSAKTKSRIARDVLAGKDYRGEDKSQ